jgi:protease YdgD
MIRRVIDPLHDCPGANAPTGDPVPREDCAWFTGRRRAGGCPPPILEGIWAELKRLASPSPLRDSRPAARGGLAFEAARSRLRPTIRVAAFLFALAAAPGAAIAGENPAKPPIEAGIGTRDSRVRIDSAAAPWRALGKLQATTGNLRQTCTGALVAPAIVLTAAHCVFNPRTRRNFPPSSLHFLLGYDRGDFVGHAVGTAILTGSGYDPLRPFLTLGSDWALLTLDKPLGTPDRILAISALALEPGAEIATGGYSQDHPLTLTVDRACRILARESDGDGTAILRHDCLATHGSSGAPVLLREGESWSIAGILVAAEQGRSGGLAALVGDARKHL